MANSIVAHLSRYLGGADPDARLAVALACQATQTGHVCADLDQEAGWGPWAGEMDGGARARMRARLPELAIVGGADELTPLVWDGRRLFLRRYWAYEQQVAHDLQTRAKVPAALGAAMQVALVSRFADAGQQNAARIALNHRLAVISGGPGTGKTHTLARIIALLLEENAAWRIALAAPTGKAAARMTEALRAAGVAAAPEGQTLHRLLGMRADGSGFYHCWERPLAVDVLVVDEASMIYLSLMAHLLAALPAAARLILLGDRDQLAAVEAGAVFADLCASRQLAPCVATLATRFRFAGGSGIGRLAEALRTGDAAGTLAQLQSATDDLDWQPRFAPQALMAAARDGYQAYREAVAAGLPAGELFERFQRFRVLCAHRQDVAEINRALSPPDGVLAQSGTPVMVVKNDPLLRLFNGDIGLVLPDPVDSTLKVCFANTNAGDGASAQPRWIPFARLPDWEVAWAMTVHKSQGSEFERVMLVLPGMVSAVVTRELVYTGVTRAKRHLSLWATAAVLQAASENRAGCMSGLPEKLNSV
ncbi:MAG: exodeoxyribonuclease V subunit alpha [Rhodocyclaceae bacterium]|nr:exodeoxyribonuclease V subunit alpha [Rhodocyclaceae bacterium]